MSASRAFRSVGFGSGAESRSLGPPAAAYPARIATNSDLIVAVDRQQTSLLLAMAAADTTMTVLDPSTVAAYNLLSIDNEIVKTTGPPAGNIVPVTRGFDGTTPAAHSTGALVLGLVDAFHHNALVSEIEAIETALGPNLSNITVGGAPRLVTSSFLFTPQTPGGSSLVVGANSITMAPVPAGVNGTDQNHYLYISGGTGTAEAVQIIGGAAVAGASSGTLIVQCANSHSGAWTIQTATSGIQEAMQYAADHGQKAIWIPGGAWPIYSLIAFPTSLSLRGMGIQATSLNFQVGFVTRAVQAINPSHGNFVDFGDLSISYSQAGTSGEALYLQEILDGVISNVYVYGCYNGVTSISTGRVYIDNVTIIPLHNGFHFSSNSTSSVMTVCVPYLCNCNISMQTGAGTALEFGPTIAGGNIVNVNTGNGQDAITASGSGTAAINELNFDNCTFDSYSGLGLAMYSSGGCPMARWQISNCKFAGLGGADSGFYLQSNPPGNIEGFTCNGTTIETTNSGGYGVNLEGVNGVVFSGMTIDARGATASYAILLDVYANQNVLISGCNLGPTNSYGLTAGVLYGVYVNNQAHNGINIVANNIQGTSSPIYNISTAPNGVRWLNNWGVDNVIPAVASAAAQAFPINPVFTLTGTTGVTSVSGLFKGQTGSFITTSGAVTFTAGATIGNTLTSTQNVPVYYWFDGTKIWLK